MINPQAASLVELRIWKASLEKGLEELDEILLQLIEQGHAKYYNYLRALLQEELAICRGILEHRSYLAA